MHVSDRVALEDWGAGGGAGLPRVSSRGGARGELAGVERSGLPGVVSSGKRVRGHLRGARGPPGPRSGHERLCGGEDGDRGGSCTAASPACGLRAVLGSGLDAKGC